VRVLLSALAIASLAGACGPSEGAETGSDARVDVVDAGAFDARERADAPVVVLMIGDGMGQGQLEAASLYAYGEPGRLFLEGMPRRGQIRTASLSGFTDSAAAATAMATGELTYNGRVGLDRRGDPAETLVELAHRIGLRAGVVSTSSLPHATPAGFTAHRDSRGQYVEIAGDQALLVQPDVMLGGGWRYFLPAGEGSVRTDEGLIAPLQAAGYDVVFSSAELHALPAPGPGDRVAGLFAADHLDYVIDRDDGTTQPTLAEMSIAALAYAEASPNGFFLVIEGARIDMASHGNDLRRAITETLAFDEAVRAVSEWAASREDVTILVTADHECGGLDVIAPRPAGVLPDVTWRWGEHTNARVDIFGSGPGSELLDGVVADHVAVHAVIEALLLGEAPSLPERTLQPDGNLGELRHLAASQLNATSFGAGFNQLDALRVDADAYGLAVGVEGVFESGHNAVVLLVDVDLGAGTGYGAIGATLSDGTGRIDLILSSMSVDAPAVPGFGVDYAVASFGGREGRREDLIQDAGLRGFVPPRGEIDNLYWYGTPSTFGEGVRTSGVSIAPTAGEGWEVLLPWDALYPDHGGGVPIGATVGIAVVLVNDDGGYTSNQSLPPFAAGTVSSPGRDPIALPGVVRFVVDSDLDGEGDGDEAPAALP
jgi:alkaline phosphatase